MRSARLFKMNRSVYLKCKSKSHIILLVNMLHCTAFEKIIAVLCFVRSNQQFFSFIFAENQRRNFCWMCTIDWMMRLTVPSHARPEASMTMKMIILSQTPKQRSSNRVILLRRFWIKVSLALFVSHTNKDFSINGWLYCMYFPTENHVAEVRHEHGRKLWFDISGVSSDSMLMMAVLRVFQNPSLGRWKELQKEFIINVYIVTKSDKWVPTYTTIAKSKIALLTQYYFHFAVSKNWKWYRPPTPHPTITVGWHWMSPKRLPIGWRIRTKTKACTLVRRR